MTVRTTFEGNEPALVHPSIATGSASDWPPPVAAWVLLLALLPSSLAVLTLSPSVTVLNQLFALAGWGVAMMALAQADGGAPRGVKYLVGALGIVVLAAVAASLRHPASDSLSLSTAALVIAALGVAASASRAGDGAQLVFCVALLMVGAADLLIALIQVFAPTLADGTVIARSSLVGRAVGNLRQPNHLSTLSLWSAVAALPLLDAARRGWKLLFALAFALFIFTVELSASRTGVVGVGVLAVWGLLDRRLSRAARLLLMAAPLIYAVGWLGMSEWAHHTQHTFGAEARLHESSDISSSRFPVWKETLQLIRANPWTGVGFGDFNFAWTLTPFPERPPEFFDHCHNIVLQLLVELGIPLGGAVVALLAVALWLAYRRAWSVEGPRGAGYRAAFMMVLLVMIHSLLEYPLWYAYFLLPAAWAWGYCLGAKRDSDPRRSDSPAAVQRTRIFFAGAGLVMVLGSAWAFQQYLTVSRIFDPGTDDRSLAARIADGQKTLFYSYHADYAAVTVADRPSTEWPAFAGATHYLLDTRLLMAWATAFAERGDLDHARYLAQRLKEFKKPEAAEFFAPCDKPTEPNEAKPFQCEPPSRAIDWREFRDPALYRQP